MGVVVGFVVTLLCALLGASFGSYCSIEYGGGIGALAGLITGLVGSHYGWERYCARRREYRLRMELPAPRKRAA
jgi:hypothetical protein